MAKYISLDTEATGLEEDTHLIQVAFVPVDTQSQTVDESLAVETLVQCPSFESLKPHLNEWVLEHNEGLIKEAHQSGLTRELFKEWVKNYFESSKVKAFFEGERPPPLGKSLSALDIPLLNRYLGAENYQKYFHHHTLDITCVARALVDAGKLPQGCESTTQLIQHFALREDARHTALSDAVDMAKIYLKLIDLLKEQG